MTEVEVSLWVSRTALYDGSRASSATDRVRVGRLAPLDLDLGDVRAVGPGDLREPVAERADRHGEDPIARRDDVDDGRLEPARAGGRDDRDVARGPEVRAHPGQDPVEHGRELRPAVVDHLAGAGLADRRREPRRAGDAQVGLEAVHGGSPGALAVTGWSGRSPVGRRGAPLCCHMLGRSCPGASRCRCRTLDQRPGG